MKDSAESISILQSKWKTALETSNTPITIAPSFPFVPGWWTATNERPARVQTGRWGGVLSKWNWNSPSFSAILPVKGSVLSFSSRLPFSARSFTTLLSSAQRNRATPTGSFLSPSIASKTRGNIQILRASVSESRIFSRIHGKFKDANKQAQNPRNMEKYRIKYGKEDTRCNIQQTQQISI